MNNTGIEHLEACAGFFRDSEKKPWIDMDAKPRSVLSLQMFNQKGYYLVEQATLATV